MIDLRAAGVPQQDVLPGLGELPAAGARTRPWHYLVLWSIPVLDESDEDTDEDTLFVDVATDDEERALAEVTGTIWDIGVWDNWTGEWTVRPTWADEFDMIAEGHCRYDLRPLNTPTDQAVS